MPRSASSFSRSFLVLALTAPSALTVACASPQAAPAGKPDPRAAGNEKGAPTVSEAVVSKGNTTRPETALESAPEPTPAPAEAARPDGSLGEAFACGPYSCRRFARLEDAFAAMMAAEKPRVLGVGESHAQAKGPQLASTTARFTNQLLPRVAPLTQALVVELMAPNADCQKKTQAVREQQKEVIETQASTNQNEFVTLGQKARSLGVVPYLLKPSCDDLAAITKAGDDDVLVMLETIARLTTKQVGEQLASQKPDSARRMVIAYGGALHNDLEPRAGRESFSYGPPLRTLLDEHHAGTYVELDLIVPELIQDGPTWRAMPWYEHYREDVARGAAVAMQLGPHRWVMFDARGSAPAASPPTAPNSSPPEAASPP